MKILFLSAVILLSATAIAGEDHSTGNGGDAIRKLFIDAKRVASHKLRRLKTCSFEGQNDVEAINFALQNSSKLASEVTNSAHYWTVDQQATCAYTTRESNAGIYLSYPTCHNSVHGMHEAVYILIHEATHHLGIVDERFGDRVATAVMNSENRDSCPNTGGEVFEPTYCQGPNISRDEVLRYFGRAESKAFFTTMQIKRRERACNTATGCATWTDAPVEFWESGGKKIPLSRLPCDFEIHDNGNSIPYRCYDQQIFMGWGEDLRRWTGTSYIKYGISEKLEIDSFYEPIKGPTTNHCFWFKMPGKTSADSNGNFFESETVFYSNYTPK